MTSLEWHLLAAFLLVLATLYWPLSVGSMVMWTAPVLLAAWSSAKAPLERGAPLWCRPLIAFLYFIQPIVRGFYRVTYLLSNKRLPSAGSELGVAPSTVKQISATEIDLYWQSEQAIGRERLLEMLVKKAKQLGWCGDFGNAWAPWDIKLIGDRWHDILIRTATEELGWPKRFTRARCTARNTRFCGIVATASVVWATAAMISIQPWAIAIGMVACTWTLASIYLSRRRCLRAVTGLVAGVGEQCGLTSITLAAIGPSANGKAVHESKQAEQVAGRSTSSRTLKDDSEIVQV